MKPKETEIILQRINGIYSNFLMGRSIDIIFPAWNRVFENQDFNIVQKKLDQWIVCENNPPKPCDLIVDTSWRKEYINE